LVKACIVQYCIVLHNPSITFCDEEVGWVTAVELHIGQSVSRSLFPRGSVSFHLVCVVRQAVLSCVTSQNTLVLFLHFLSHCLYSLIFCTVLSVRQHTVRMLPYFKCVLAVGCVHV